MTQREFASLLEVSDVTVTRWLHAERNPSVKMIEKIARVLETSPSNLLSEDDGPYYEEIEPEEEKDIAFICSMEENIDEIDFEKIFNKDNIY